MKVNQFMVSWTEHPEHMTSVMFHRAPGTVTLVLWPVSRFENAILVASCGFADFWKVWIFLVEPNCERVSTSCLIVFRHLARIALVESVSGPARTLAAAFGRAMLSVGTHCRGKIKLLAAGSIVARSLFVEPVLWLDTASGVSLVSSTLIRTVLLSAGFWVEDIPALTVSTVSVSKITDIHGMNLPKGLCSDRASGVCRNISLVPYFTMLYVLQS